MDCYNTELYKLSGRAEHQEDSVIDIGGVKLGGGHFALIAGPCAVESSAQILASAMAVKAGGAQLLRGGAFKPRSSPYSFQGLHEVGLELLRLAKEKSDLPTVSEITDTGQLPLFADVDMIQVGARNMQNFDLLHELGRQPKPVLLKRGPASTIEELLLSAEHIMAGGNQNVVLCERGIRTFATHTRNTLDLSAIPLLKRLSHLPVIADPSHGTGLAALVRPMSLAAVAAGADGLLIEVHNDPSEALCDGPQALTPAEFAELARAIEKLRARC